MAPHANAAAEQHILLFGTKKSVAYNEKHMKVFVSIGLYVSKTTVQPITQSSWTHIMCKNTC